MKYNISVACTDVTYRNKDHSVTITWMSWINPLQGALAFSFSSGRGITLMLFLSEGAAGRNVSPIWSKNLAPDLLYVCSKRHSRGNHTRPATLSTIRYQREGRDPSVDIRVLYN